MTEDNISRLVIEDTKSPIMLIHSPSTTIQVAPDTNGLADWQSLFGPMGIHALAAWPTTLGPVDIQYLDRGAREFLSASLWD